MVYTYIGFLRVKYHGRVAIARLDTGRDGCTMLTWQSGRDRALTIGCPRHSFRLLCCCVIARVGVRPMAICASVGVRVKLLICAKPSFIVHRVGHSTLASSGDRLARPIRLLNHANILSCPPISLRPTYLQLPRPTSILSLLESSNFLLTLLIIRQFSSIGVDGTDRFDGGGSAHVVHRTSGLCMVECGGARTSSRRDCVD